MKLARVGNKTSHGRACYATGGRVEEDISDPGSLPVMSKGSRSDGIAGIDGAKAKPRLDRKSPSTTVNIVVSSSKPEPAAPPMPMGGPPMPPPAAMPPPGLPMRARGGRVCKAAGGPVASGQSSASEKQAEARSVGRKHGGRVMDAGAGGGLGRLEKAKDYGAKPAKGK